MKRGFSQIEVLGAVLVVAVGLLSIVASFIYHFRVTRTSYERMQQAALCSRVMSAVRQKPIWTDSLPEGVKDAEGVSRALNEPPLEKESFSPEELQRYRRNIQARRLSGDHNQTLFVVQVRLEWQERDGSAGHLTYQAYQKETPPEQ